MTEQEQALAQVRTAVQRFVQGRTDEDGEDVVQEAMTRLLENRDRLEPAAWASYAVVSAGNLLRDRERAGEVHRRHEHRLHVPDAQGGPEEQLLTDEEHGALRRAMIALEGPEASLLAQHYVDRERSNRSIAPATAARLARARAKLRVAYVLEQGRAPLPTARCRPVLEALSAGDRRRQERLGTGRHLLSCRACATHAPALLDRRRALAGLSPLGWVAFAIGAAWASMWASVRRHPGRTAAASGAVVAATVIGATALSAAQDPTPAARAASTVEAAPDEAPGPPDGAAASPGATGAAPSAGARPSGGPQASSGDEPGAGPSTLVVGGTTVPLDGAAVSSTELALGAARGVGLPVQDVAADEGFWLGTGPGRRVWLQVFGGGESPQQVQVGDRVSFEGQAVRLPSGGAARLGLSVDEGGAELERLGGYLRVDRSDLVVLPR